MDADTALEMAQAAGTQHKLRLSFHVIYDHPERGISAQDIHAAAASATSASLQRNGKWKIDGGVDMDGDELTLICVLVDDVFVVTAY